jgi:hypothetical protein
MSIEKMRSQAKIYRPRIIFESKKIVWHSRPRLCESWQGVQNKTMGGFIWERPARIELATFGFVSDAL